MYAIVVDNVSYHYDFVQALSDVSFAAHQQQIYGLIGPDGAGKTTLLRMMCGLIKLQQGKITLYDQEVNLHNYHLIRNLIGYMPQRFSLYQDLTVMQNILFFAHLYKVNQAELRIKLGRLLQAADLNNFTKRKVGALSGGMKQKLALVCALIHEPRLMILDEPTYGVDPVSRREFWRLLHDIKTDGSTLIVTTPYMDEAEKCDQISLINNGRLLKTGSTSSIKAELDMHVYTVVPFDVKVSLDFLRARPEILGVNQFGNELHIISKSMLNPSELLKGTTENMLDQSSWKQIPATMEDIFLSLMHK